MLQLQYFLIFILFFRYFNEKLPLNMLIYRNNSIKSKSNKNLNFTNDNTIQKPKSLLSCFKNIFNSYGNSSSSSSSNHDNKHNPIISLNVNNNKQVTNKTINDVINNNKIENENKIGNHTSVNANFASIITPKLKPTINNIKKNQAIEYTEIDNSELTKNESIEYENKNNQNETEDYGYYSIPYECDINSKINEINEDFFNSQSTFLSFSSHDSTSFDLLLNNDNKNEKYFDKSIINNIELFINKLEDLIEIYIRPLIALNILNKKQYLILFQNMEKVFKHLNS